MNQYLKICPSHFFSALFFVVILVLSFLPQVQAGTFIDRENAIFFPEKLGTTIQSYKNFPVTWWNFLIFDMNGIENGWEEAQSVCDHLKNSGHLISRIECRQDWEQYIPLLQSWARDAVLRHDRPSDESLLSSFNRTLAKATLPLDKSILSHLRSDPLEFDRELEALVSRHLQFGLERTNGFLFHSLSRRILIPVQFHFPPDRDDLTAQFYEKLNEHCMKKNTCENWVLVGPHASTWENKNQIMMDVSSVSTVGTAVLIFFCVCLILIGRFRLLLIIPPILFSIFLASVTTVLVFGSIHGLVLSFGVGLVGISFDYGSHSALNPGVKSIWAANWFGYLTTVAVFGVLMFSEIPLLRQLMFFSFVGLTFSFFTLLLLHWFFPEYARAKPISFVPQVRKWKIAIVILVCLGLFFSWRIPLRLDLSGFDFQSSLQRAESSWLFKNVKTAKLLFEVHSMEQNHSILDDLSKRLKWGDSQGIHVENAASYLPPIVQQMAHLKTWENSCGPTGFLQKLNDQQKKFFAPYLKTIACDVLKPNGLSSPPYPPYVADFNSGRQWVTLWFPKNPLAAGQISREFPQAASLKSLADSFPTILASELAWMGPLSFVLVTVLLFLYFKNLELTLVALIPFVTNLGLISWFHFIFELQFSFVGLVALVMLYGMSVDFGIFATDTYRYSKENKACGVWTAVCMAALTTIAGFIPLNFCRHPVLVDLGRTLTIGMLGTVLGTFWGVPFVLKRLGRGTS